MICCLMKVSGLVMSTSTSGLLSWFVRPSFTTSGKYLEISKQTFAGFFFFWWECFIKMFSVGVQETHKWFTMIWHNLYLISNLKKSKVKGHTNANAFIYKYFMHKAKLVIYPNSVCGCSHAVDWSMTPSGVSLAGSAPLTFTLTSPAAPHHVQNHFIRKSAFSRHPMLYNRNNATLQLHFHL